MSHPSPATPTSRSGPVPVDVAAVLSAMQDQLDDLTAVVEAQQRRLDALERTQLGHTRKP